MHARLRSTKTRAHAPEEQGEQPATILRKASKSRCKPLHMHYAIPGNTPTQTDPLCEDPKLSSLPPAAPRARPVHKTTPEVELLTFNKRRLYFPAGISPTVRGSTTSTASVSSVMSPAVVYQACVCACQGKYCSKPRDRRGPES